MSIILAAGPTVASLILLHGPTGREIRINPRNVTSLQSPQSPGKNQVLIDGVNCLINTSDGKFVSVVETCPAVAKMLEVQK